MVANFSHVSRFEKNWRVNRGKNAFGTSKICRIIRVVVQTVVKCRNNRGKIHGKDRLLAGPN